MIARILANPHYLTGSKVCKLLANLGTAIWAIGVLVKKDALAATAYSQVSTYIHEDIIAGILMFISAFQMLCLWAHWRPVWFGATGGYFVFVMWWGWVLSMILIGPGSAQPTALMGASLVFLLSLYAFVSWPRRERDGLCT